MCSDHVTREEARETGGARFFSTASSQWKATEQELTCPNPERGHSSIHDGSTSMNQTPSHQVPAPILGSNVNTRFGGDKLTNRSRHPDRSFSSTQTTNDPMPTNCVGRTRPQALGIRVSLSGAGSAQTCRGVLADPTLRGHGVSLTSGESCFHGQHYKCKRRLWSPSWNPSSTSYYP